MHGSSNWDERQISVPSGYIDQLQDLRPGWYVEQFEVSREIKKLAARCVTVRHRPRQIEFAGRSVLSRQAL